MEYIITGKLNMVANGIDIGPCETELMVTIIMIVAAIFGYQQMDDHFIGYFPQYIQLYIDDSIKLQHILTGFFTFLLVIFSFETWITCIRKAPRVTLRMLIKLVMVLLPILTSAYLETETYKHQFVIFHLFHSWVMNQAAYNLMIANMTKKSKEELNFGVFGIENVIAWIPNLVHFLIKGNQKRMIFEPLATYVCMMYIFVYFYA